jgi:Ca2+-binding EF-hand superfamily protein
MYDKNGDSKITLDEFGDVIKSLGLNPSEDQLAVLMQEIDLDGSGTGTMFCSFNLVPLSLAFFQKIFYCCQYCS